jgi:GNAT superfamily N-acetyltransferase
MVRAERVEHGATRDLVAAAAGEVAARVGIAIDVVGGAEALSCQAAPDVIFNRVMGLGIETPARRDDIEALRERYRARGIDRYIVHVAPHAQPPELAGWLAGAGFTPFRRAWMKFAMATGGARPVPRTDRLELREIGREHGDAFGAMIGRVFDLPLLAPAFALLPGRAGWHFWMAFDGDTPAAAAGMFADGHDAWLGFGACDAGFRGRGAQSALLATRVGRAAELGCRDAFVETGEAVEGEPQTSYRNIERAGFAPLYARANLLAPA